MTEEKKDQTMDDVWNELLILYPIHDLVKFSEFDITDKLAINPWQITTFTEIYEKEKDKLEKIIEIKDKVVCELYDHYRFNDSRELKQSEIEKYYIPKDNKIIKINKIIRKQQWVVNFFSMCIKAFDKQYWAMKTFYDTIRRG